MYFLVKNTLKNNCNYSFIYLLYFYFFYVFLSEKYFKTIYFIFLMYVIHIN